MHRNKDLERWHVERFRENCSDFPDGDIVHSERPDFLVVGRYPILGIEHTQYFRPPLPGHAQPLQAQEALRDRLLKKAKALYDAGGGPALHVAVCFSEAHPLSSPATDLNDAAAALVRLVASAQSRILDNDYGDAQHFPFQVDKVAIWDMPPQTGSFWHSAEGWSEPGLSVSTIKALIEKHERQIDVYRSKAPEIWLLIVAHGTRESSSGRLNPLVFVGPYVTSFDRVFFYDSFLRNPFELGLAR